jgi:uncharacterized protein YciI
VKYAYEYRLPPDPSKPDKETTQMFIVFLKFSAHRDKAATLMDEHNAWIKKGLEDEVFLLVGTLQPKLGGCIVAHQTTLPVLQERINDDPFVRADVVQPEILEVSPSRADERLQFLLELR